MHSLFSLKLLLIASTLFCLTSVAKPIITRHDVSDSSYVLLAGNYPETHALFFFNKTDMAGILISRNWVLSAAHVAAYLAAGDSIYSRKKACAIRRIIIHPEWQNDQAFDLALIRIDMQNDSITPVPVYSGDDELKKLVLIAGNGDRGTGVSGPAGNDGQLRAATNRVDEVSDFWLKWDFSNPATDSTAVTPMEGVSGPGDSGGPAFIVVDGKRYLAGISSAQSTRATGGREGRYGVREYYVRLSRHTGWIKATLLSD